MSNTVKQAGITSESGVNSLSIATQGKSQTIGYFDGISRPIQTVITNGSASQKDLVTGVEYDQYGREVRKYLTYADQNSTTYGSYKDNWNNTQVAYYNGGLPNVDPDPAPYSVAVFEASSLNRLLAQGAPGTAWQPNTFAPFDVSTHSVQYKNILNKYEDNVRIFNVDSAGNITTPDFYPPGSLTEKLTIDEQQQTVKEFTDKSGHVLLKRVMLASDSLQTYYLFDNLGMLRGVIQPEGTVALRTASWIFPATFKKLWMFLYRYDERNRMVMKKVPGADSVLIFYDQWDRIVLTQDSNLRAVHNFLFTKYDALNRAVVTGQIIDTRTLDLVRSSVMSSTGRFDIVNTSATEGYTLTGCFPSSGSYTLTIYTITHYDSYANLPSWSSGYSFVSEYGVAPQNNFLTGQVVATQTRVLGTSTFYRTVSYYDDKYRLIQTTNDNAAGGKDRVTKVLSFEGKILNDYHSHTSRFFTTPLLTQQTYTYDHMDRLLNVTHKTAAQEVVTLIQNSYDEVGQLLNKKLHQSTSHPNVLQKLDYYYNIRGWLNSVNRPLTTQTGYEENDLFNEELHYGNNFSLTSTIPNFNGNISEEVWKGGYDEYYRAYRLAYDGANRLTDATYGYKYVDQYGPEWSLTKRYNESGISYDHNGNLLLLSRYHGDYNMIDALNYKAYSGNQLGHVDDYSSVVSPIGFQDKNNGSNDYTYDPNGNTTSDYNKSITSISYNYLNLPNVVTITAKGSITYTYDAAGNKLQKTMVDNTVVPAKTTNYYYAGDYVYRNDTLEFISHPEGRLRPVRVDTTQPISIANLKYLYDYYLKDHLGSVRSVITTEQQTDFYAATMETAAATKENLLFNNISSTDTAKPTGFTNDVNNKMVSKLNGDGTTGNKRVGPSIVLKVMTGDTISIQTWGWYKGAVQPPPANATTLATELFPLLQAGVAAAGGGKGGAIPSTTSDPLLSADITSFLSSNIPYDNSRPKAFLNWMVVDEEFAGVTSTNHMNALQVPVCNSGDTTKKMVGLANLVIRRNGWIYIYLSNESAQSIYFDNLVVNLKHGPLVEQKDYYAFGMEIPGLSTKAIKINYDENRYRYNGIEYDSAFGINEFEAHFRDLDPAIGRWTTIDPDIEQGSEDISPYASMSDNPILKTDPLGNQDEECCGGLVLSPIIISPKTEDRFVKSVEITGRQIMNATGGAEAGVLNTLTFGATPTTPLFPSAYTDEDMSQFNAGVTVGQYAPLLEGVEPTPGASVVPNGGAIAVPYGFKLYAPELTVFQLLTRKSKPNYGKSGGTEHTKNARNSTSDKHQGAQARQNADRQGGKGMKNPPLKRPKGHKGPWPVKKNNPPPKPPPPAKTTPVTPAPTSE